MPQSCCFGFQSPPPPPRELVRSAESYLGTVKRQWATLTIPGRSPPAWTLAGLLVWSTLLAILHLSCWIAYVQARLLYGQ